MNKSNWMLTTVLSGGMLSSGLCLGHADEQLFGIVRSAETLPKGRTELYQFATLHTGKAEGTYYGLDLETEVEHGFTDKFQASLAVENRYFNNHGVNGDRDALDDKNQYRFGGITGSAKYRLLSTFADPIGLSVRLESGYLFHDDVDGLGEKEIFVAPEVDVQKDFLDDTLITAAWAGMELAWGKRPAEEYPREMSWQGGTGVAYRFAPNWFVGLESDARAEYPMFDFNNFEHVVIYGGPSIHYSARRWWVTLSYLYQIWGNGVGEPADGRTYAEESDMQIMLKVGFNF